MGWENVFNCEWEEFPRQVLKHHFPNAIQYGDIKELNATTHLGRVDILTGGFPCQPYSLAGKRMGKEDERHLWPEMCRVIREVRPRWVVGENVRGLIGWNGGMVFDEVQANLEAEGYEVTPYVLPACAVNAPHRRDRVWFVAYAHDKGRGNAPDTNGNKSQRRDRQAAQKRAVQDRRIETFGQPRGWQAFPTVPPVCGGNDGLPKELDGVTFSKWRRESIKAYGNAIVPQVALQIFKVIEQY